MDAAQLARWTRFAAKGGIGKCTAVCDCVAQNPEDLMFLKGDEIVVLMRISDSEDIYLGSCEDIIGRFRGKDVRFHGKLKRPIKTRRSSVSATKSPSPHVGQSTPSPSRSNSLTRKDKSPSVSFSHPPPLSAPNHVLSLPSTDDEGPNPPSTSISASATPPDSIVATPPRALGGAPKESLSSNPGCSIESSRHLSSPPPQSPRIALPNSPPVLSPVISPLNIIKKSPTSSPLHQSSFAASQEQPLDTHSSIPLNIPDNSYSTYAERPSQDADSDGEVGIGLSLLQNLVHGADSDEDSAIELANVRHDDESTVEGLMYDEPDDEGYARSGQQTPAFTPRLNVEYDVSTSHGQQSQVLSLPPPSSPPHSPTSPASFTSLSPPANQQRFSVSSRRPSLQSSGSWEGAGDIYDDYRYSRASMMSGTTGRARRTSVNSKMSANSKASHRDLWDGYVYEQPPPVPDSRPSIDSIIASESSTKVANDAARRSIESRKSTETRKSTGSRKSTESESRRSRQELLFPQPPTNVNIQPDLLDHAARESLRRSSEASRTLTPADFRLSVESEASIYSRLSVVEQETVGTAEIDSSLPSAPVLPESPTQQKTGSAPGLLRPMPLDLTSNGPPLLHTTWASPMSSPSESAFGSTSATSPTSSLLMPPALASFTAGMASALRQKVETDRSSDDQPQGRDQIREEEETQRDIVVGDEEEIPSGVMQESTFSTEYSQDTALEDSKDTIVLPESVQAAPRDAPNPRTPPPASPLEKPSVLGDLEPPPSPMVPSQPPIIEIHHTNAPPEPMPTSPTSSAPPAHLRPPRPTLADLREGGGAPIPGTNQRQSLFLPHPNAPKAPTVSGPGPMYIALQQRHPTQHQQAASIAPKQSVIDVIHMAIQASQTPAMRSRMMRGPTIYARTDIDLSTSTGPVPITFSIEPPPRQPTPYQSPQHQSSFHRQSPQQVAAHIAPSSPTSAIPLPSNSSAPVVPGPERIETGADTGSSVPKTSRHSETGEVIPRANFFPKAPGVRPRSRSFSAFNSHSTQLEVPLPLSREEGSKPVDTPTANEVRQDLKPRAGSGAISPPAMNQTGPNKPSLKTSPLHPSPLHTGSSFPRSNPPTSPLAHSFHPPSVSSTAPPSPTVSATGLRPPHQLRQVTSRATLNDGALSKPSLSSTNPPDASGSPVATSGNLPGESHIPPRDPGTSPPPRDQNPGPESDSISMQSDTNSHPVSPTPALNRQTSLRAKLSLPNLRRNRSKPDEGLTLASPIKEDFSNTVQVQDLDFELVRPTIQLQNARSSEDSGVLGRDASMELPSRDALHQRAMSPSGSLGGPKSPTSDSFSAWPRPSISSNIAPIITRATADTESNMDAHRQRESKWMSLMGSIAPSQWRKSKKVKKLIHEGVPSSVRYLVWSHLTDGKAKVVPGVYYQLGNRDRIAVANTIEEDIKASFQDQPHLQGKRGPVLALLQAYLTMVPDVHYTMGLTLIAGQLLLHAPEEDAFWIFVSIMDTHIRPYFSTSTIQMEVDATLFSRVVENNDSQLAKKLYVDMGIEPSAICDPWFSTLFVSTLPPDYVNRVWDLFLYEGVPFLLRVGFAVMTCCRRQILGATSPEVVLDYLQHPLPGWLPSTPEGFLTLAHSVKMKDDDIRKNRLKMEAQVKRQAQAQTPRHLPITTSISLPRS